MEVISAVLIGATLLNAAKNLVELSFMVGDDPVKEKKMKFRTNRFDRNNQARHYFLTIEGNRIIDVEPID